MAKRFDLKNLFKKSKQVLAKNRKRLAIFFSLLLLAALLFLAKGLFIAAIVNGQPIFRLSLIKELEKQGGTQVLSGIITEKLIFQEAKKQNVVVGRSEIEAEIAKIKESVKGQGQDLEQLLTLQGQTITDLEKNIVIQKTIEKLLGKEIEVSDEEIAKYIKDGDLSPEKGQSQEDFREKIRQDLRQTKLEEKFQTWLEELKSKAKINYLIKL